MRANNENNTPAETVRARITAVSVPCVGALYCIVAFRVTTYLCIREGAVETSV